MLEILETVLPVLVMLGLGMVCKKKVFLSRSCMDGMKFLVVKVMLPIAVFHGLATAEYGSYTVISVGIMFTVMALTFGLGFLLRPVIGKPYNKYLPFVVSVYEGGMIAYPLYTSLVGVENLSVIAMIDISGLLFCFGIFCNVLVQMEEQTKVSVRNVVVNALKNPAFIATVLGVIVGLTGVVNRMLMSPVGPVYMNVKDMLVAAMSPMILMVVGYDFELSKELLKPCLKSIGLRAITQGVFAVAVIFLLHRIVGENTLLDVAIITYMSAPGSFSVQTFLKDENAQKYIASCNSLYMIITIAVYTILAGILA
ncbi:MAG: permease [Lachnospiraceae bacterium]|nr:permease [Lachnospiraceae bacterium]MDD6505474.1 permease [Lachnospiraceae bacterium]